MNRWMSFIALAIVLGLAAGSAQAGAGNKGAKADKANKAGKRDHGGVAGLVQKIDGSNIIVQTGGKKGPEVTVITDSNTKFEGVKSLDDIKPGMRVMATPNTGTATKVIVRDAGARGKGAKKNKQ